MYRFHIIKVTKNQLLVMLHNTHTHVLEEAMEKNKVAVTLGPGNIVIQDMPYPKLQKGGAILRNKLCGVCGTDKLTYYIPRRNHSVCRHKLWRFFTSLADVTIGSFGSHSPMREI